MEESFITLQSWFADINQENYKDIKDKLVNSQFFNTDYGFRTVINEIIKINLISKDVNEIQVDLIQSLCVISCKQSNKQFSFKNTLLEELFYPKGSDSIVPNLILAKKCMNKGIFTVNSVIEFIKMRVKPSNYDVFPYVFLCFAQDIEKLYPELFKDYLKKFKRSRINDKLLIDCINNFNNTWRKNRYELLNHCIDHGFDRDSRELSIKNDDIETVKQYFEASLISEKCKHGIFDILTSQIKEDMTYLELAALYGSEQVFSHLIQFFDPLPESISKWAVVGGNMKIIEECYSRGSSFQDSLQMAARFRRNNIFKWIILNTQPSDQAKRDALMEAFKYNNFFAASELIKSGTSAKELYRYAAESDNVEMIELYMPKDVEYLDQIAIHSALNGGYRVLSYVLENNYEVNKRLEDNKTLAHYCAIGGSVKCLKLLIKNKIEINTFDNLHRSPIHYACIHNRYEMVKELLRKGSESKGKDTEGNSLIDSTESEDILIILREARKYKS